jgi:hypothetical protein
LRVGLEAGKLTVNLTIEYEWKPLTNQKGKVYTFPTKLSEFERGFSSRHSTPAIYRWVVKEEDNILAVYIGETENLSRRIGGYLNPGPSQQTNIWLNQLFRDCINCGLNVELEVLNFHAILNGHSISQLELEDKHTRLMIESLMVKAQEIENTYIVLNRDIKKETIDNCESLIRKFENLKSSEP